MNKYHLPSDRCFYYRFTFVSGTDYLLLTSMKTITAIIAAMQMSITEQDFVIDIW